MNITRRKPTTFDEIPYLLHHLSFMVDKELDHELTRQLGIGLSQLKILYVLDRWPYSQQGSVAKILGQAKSGVSRQIQYLVDEGYAVAKQNPKDRRQKNIALTASGAELLKKARLLVDACHQTALAPLGPQQQQSLRAMLELLHRRSCTPDKGCERYIR